MRIYTGVMLLLALVGCSVAYVRGDGSAANPRDVQECEYEATKAVSGQASGMLAGWNKGDVSRQCLALRGIRRVYQ